MTGFEGCESDKNLTDRYDFRGYLQCDGYSAYTAAYVPCSGVRLVHYMQHIFREWDKGMSQDPVAVTWFKAKIQDSITPSMNVTRRDSASMNARIRENSCQGL